MPYKRHKPVPEFDMNKQMKNEHTICNTLRDIYHHAVGDEIRLKCRIAMAMAKSMCDKLTYYHDLYGGAVDFEKFRQPRDPVSLSEMDITRWEGHHTICQTIRDMYHLTDDPALKMKCRVGMAMTKAMNERLQYYKHVFIEHIPHGQEVPDVDYSQADH